MISFICIMDGPRPRPISTPPQANHKSAYFAPQAHAKHQASMNAQFHINCSGQVQSTARGATKEVHITLQNKRNPISHPKSFTLHHLLTFLLLPPASPAISGGSCCSSLDTPLSPVIALSISIAAIISST